MSDELEQNDGGCLSGGSIAYLGLAYLSLFAQKRLAYSWKTA
jgi:hypothetical protein